MMKKKLIKNIFILSLFSIGGVLQAQSSNTASVSNITNEKEGYVKPYKPTENAAKRLQELSTIAKKQNKKILVQAGGNWCIWCLRLNNFIMTNEKLKSKIEDKYIVYHLNYSKENENKALFAKFGNPGKTYGYPVWLILDQNLTLLKTQDTGSLENGKSYDESKILKALSL